MNNIIDLFKIPAYEVKLNLDTKNILNYFLSLNLPGRNVSNIGGYQSQDLTGKHLNINDLFLKIIEHGNIFSKSIDVSENLKISNLWLNINKHRDLNVEHNHTGAVISGVYYLKVPKNSGNIIFKHPCNDFMAYAWPNKKIVPNNYSCSQWFLNSEENKLILFPGWLKHQVEPNMSKKDRISISFNLI